MSHYKYTVNNYLKPVLEAGVQVFDILVDEAGELEMFLCPLGRLLLISLSQAWTPIKLRFKVKACVSYNLRQNFAVLRIRDVYPGSRILILSIQDTGSRRIPIPDPTTAPK